jgi:capsular exopolysaccharide synthesis family protein
MSHIFDALQKTAAEGSDVEIPSALLAAELLQAAERKHAEDHEASFETDSAVAVATEPESLFETESTPDVPVTTRVQLDAEIPNQPEPSAKHAAIDQFSQFQSLKLLVSPRGRLVCVTDKDSLAAEKFRFLGVRLRQLRQSRPLKKVLITSSIPQEGKSMVAANLACTLAKRMPNKTLLLEGDLRRPSLSQLFGIGKLPGISEWLHGEQGALSSIYQLEGTGLCILPAGSASRNPLELMQSGTLSALMEQLATWFEWIVIDSPPILPLGDTSLWMRVADGVLLVARQGTTTKKQLQRGLEAIEPAKLLGALLNGAETSGHEGYYYHYSSPVTPSTKESAKKS